MIYFLMHENDKLAIMDYENQAINGIVINDRMTDRLPFLDSTSKTKEEGLAAWIMNRGIPVTR